MIGVWIKMGLSHTNPTKRTKIVQKRGDRGGNYNKRHPFTGPGENTCSKKGGGTQYRKTVSGCLYNHITNGQVAADNWAGGS